MKNRKPSGNSILRFIFVIVSILLQVGWILILTLKLNTWSSWMYALTSLFSIGVVLRLNSKHTNAAMKTPWVILILILPVMGLSLYLLVDILSDPGVGKRLHAVREDMKDEIPANAEAALEDLEQQDLASANQARYLWNCNRWPVYEIPPSPITARQKMPLKPCSRTWKRQKSSSSWNTSLWRTPPASGKSRTFWCVSGLRAWKCG